MLTDVAICKIPPMPNGVPHQALSLSLQPFKKDEQAYAIGYAEMKNIARRNNQGAITADGLALDLYASFGPVVATYPQNHVTREIMVPRSHI